LRQCWAEQSKIDTAALCNRHPASGLAVDSEVLLPERLPAKNGSLQLLLLLFCELLDFWQWLHRLSVHFTLLLA